MEKLKILKKQLTERCLVFFRTMPARKKRTYWCVLLSLFLFAAIYLEATHRLHPPASIESPRYLRARRPISRGAFLYLADIGIDHDLSAEEGDRISDQQFYLFENAVAAQNIAEGEWIRRTQLKYETESELRTLIPKGKRAYSIEAVSEVPVEKGDRIDIFLSSENFQGGSAIAERVLVLRAIRKANPSRLIIALSHEQIQLVEKARTRGKLTIALRNPEDRHPEMKPRVTLKRRPETRVEMLYGGE